MTPITAEGFFRHKQAATKYFEPNLAPPVVSGYSGAEQSCFLFRRQAQSQDRGNVARPASRCAPDKHVPRSAGQAERHLRGRAACQPQLFAVRRSQGGRRRHGRLGPPHKMPTLLYLYPDNAYFDRVSLAKISNADPTSSLAVLTTDVLTDLANPDLKPARSPNTRPDSRSGWGVAW